MRETITINIKSIRYLNENTSVLRAWKLILPVLPEHVNWYMELISLTIDSAIIILKE